LVRPPRREVRPGVREVHSGGAPEKIEEREG